jgi:hypothetical protein
MQKCSILDFIPDDLIIYLSMYVCMYIPTYTDY